MEVDDILEEPRYLNFSDFLKNFILLKEESEYLKTFRKEDSEELPSPIPVPLRKQNSVDFLVNDILNHDLKIHLYRRVYWPLLLNLYNSRNLEDLIKEIEKKRNSYKQDKEEYIIKPNNLDIQKLDPQIFHPLCSDDKNPWILKQKNQELKDEIKQDILRTHSDKPIFQNENIRTILNEILFVWAKKNPWISYKQGMNEILAIFLIINYRERADPLETFETFETIQNEYYDDSCTNDIKQNKEKYFRIFQFLFDTNEIEADSFILFDHFLNMGVKYLFSASVDEKKTQISKHTCKTVLIQKCTYIFHKILKNSDKVLYNHLISLSIEPQIFLLRWIRLFYCREFKIDDVIILWDYFFSDCYSAIIQSQRRQDGELLTYPFEFKGDNVEIAHKTSDIFPLVDYFSISMVLFIRSFLLENDETNCLKRLFKYPPVENIRTLIDLAFKIKYRNEKKEKSGKKEDFIITNKTIGNTTLETDGRGTNPLMTNMNVNGTTTTSSLSTGVISSGVISSGVISTGFVSTGDVNIKKRNSNSGINTNSLFNISKNSFNDYKYEDPIIRPLVQHDNEKFQKKWSMNSNLTNSEINEDVKKREKYIEPSNEPGIESGIDGSFGFAATFHSYNSNDINENIKKISDISSSSSHNNNNLNNLNIISNNLNQIISNLNALSVNLTNEQHRIELQQNIFHLNGIKKQLQFLGKKENICQRI